MLIVLHLPGSEISSCLRVFRKLRNTIIYGFILYVLVVGLNGKKTIWKFYYLVELLTESNCENAGDYE